MTDRPLQGPGNQYTPPEGWATSRKGGAPYEWVGDESATVDDVKRLRDWKEGAEADTMTLLGTFHKNWTSEYWDANRDLEIYYRDCPGGAGSIHYEYQKVGGEYNGVTFAKEPIWHYNAEGELVKGDSVPGDAGEYHTAYHGDGHKDNYVGPEPESKAEEVLGGGKYNWNEDEALYEII